MIERTPEGYWVVVGETHLNVWVRETRRLDHDRYLIPIAQSHITRGSTVIDVGANIGSHTIAYLESTGPEGKVFAYDPHPDSFSCLILNCPEAVTKQCAIGAVNGVDHLTMHPGNLGASFLSREGIEVPMTTLDTELNNGVYPGHISFIKIDVEGCEVEVLFGAEKLITEHRPVLMIEINNSHLLRRGHSYGEMFSFIKTHSYNTEFFPPQGNWDYPQCDAVFTPV
jgi:FkbM family methyltransferase